LRRLLNKGVIKMKTHGHHAVEAALKKCGYTMDQVDVELNKSRGWTWLVLQGKKTSPCLLRLLPEFYQLIRERDASAATVMAGDIFKTNDFNQLHSYLDGCEDMIRLFTDKFKIREKTV